MQKNFAPPPSSPAEHSTSGRKRLEVDKDVSEKLVSFDYLYYEIRLLILIGLLRRRSQVYYNKRRRVDKCGKGLRHFSMKVCEKVRNKGTTTYNEVADELVAEFTNPAVPPIMEQVRYSTCIYIYCIFSNSHDTVAIRPKKY